MKRIVGLLLFFWAISGFSASVGKSVPAPDAELFSGLKPRNIGPALTSGRISDIAIHPRKRSTWYVAVGSGGLWKTINAGTTWTPIFDDQPSYSIGCVTIDPNTPEVVWVGTGENVSGRHVGFGDGVYKSLNGGKTWKNTGLRRSEHIGKILVDPRDSNVVYVAAEGPLWSAGGERGLYKTTDGGKTWQPCLTISKDTGITDVEFEHGNPDILYAAAYQRRRSVAAFRAGGPESGIYKSTDAGKHWRKLDVGLPKGHMGKIGLAVSPHKPAVIYATIEAGKEEKGFYRSEDRGESWEKRNSYTSGGTGPHYYQEIYACPHQFDRVYQMDVWIHVTHDGGKQFQRVGRKHKHSDNHALVFDPGDPDYLMVGTDGGLFRSWDRGKSWEFIENLAVTQFYKLALDNDLPFYNINGGTQDNGTQMGPSRTLNVNGIMRRDWTFTCGADGYATAFDPTAPDTIYASWQVGHLVRFDNRSGEEVDIQPRPAIDGAPQRWNWDSPLIISPHSPTRLYYGSQALYRSDNRGNSWTPVSPPDLTRGAFRLEQKLMGRQWDRETLWDHDAMSFYGNLTTLSESPLKEGLIYAGTDDGLIRVTEDGGKQWRKIDNIPGVPSYFFVNDIKASLHQQGTVFAALDNHKTGDLKPYLVKSTNYGRTWTSITGDLPPRHIVWAIAQDHVKKDLLFIGTEFGMYFTLDGGGHWIKITGGVPPVPFRDIEIHQRENDLVGASFGRGIFVLDDYTPLRHINPELLAQKAALFPVKKALAYIPRRPFELRGKATQGHRFFTAPNPPFGAVFTYYLKKSLKTGKELALERARKLPRQGKSVPFPGWETIRQELNEKAPKVVLTVIDEGGRVIRRIAGPTDRGLHRVAWDLRYPPVSPTELAPKDLPPWQRPKPGPMVVPGTYRVRLAIEENGVATALGDPQTFVVEPLTLATFPAADRAELLAFQRKAGELQRAMRGSLRVIKEARKHLEYLEKALPDTPGADSKWGATIRDLDSRLLAIKAEISGDPARQSLHEARLPGLLDRVKWQVTATSDITDTRKRDYQMAATRFETLLETLRQLVEKDLRKLQSRMEGAGAPWTPGRGVPRWKKDLND